MTMQSKIIAHEKRFTLENLVLSPLNPRQVVSDPEVEEMAESIWEAGLIQQMAGYEADTGVAEIVGGGRRLRALKFLATKHPDLAELRPELANPLVNLAKDAEQAQIWATTENVARKALHPAQEIRAYGQLAAKQTDVEKIARMFAVTDAHVRRRLALANLPTPIINALEANEINLTAATCFTISNDETHSLEVLEGVKEGRYNEHSLRRALKPDSVLCTDRRALFVGEEAYKEVGGIITNDLFNDKKIFDDSALLEATFNELAKEAGETVRQEQGWLWVEVVTDSPWINTYGMGLEKYGRVYREEGVLDEIETAQYDDLSELYETGDLSKDQEKEFDRLQGIIDGDYTDAQKEFAGAFICITNEGKVAVSGGYIQPDKKKAATEAGVLPKSSHRSSADVKKSPISKALAEDLARIACRARQHAIINDPDLLVALLAYQLTHTLHWQTPFGISSSSVPNNPTTEGEGYTPDDRILQMPKGDMTSIDLGKSFRAFLKKGSKHARKELNRALAAKYEGGSAELRAMIDKATKPNIRSIWTPTKENFFKRVGGPYMIDVWCDLLEIEKDHPTAIAFAKKNKSEKSDEMEKLFGDAQHRAALGVTDAQNTRIAAWLPEGMA